MATVKKKSGDEKKASAKKAASGEVVTKVRVLKDTGSEKVTKIIAEPVKKADKKEKPTKAPKEPREKNGNYFVGAWRELRQVKWPTRRTTWSLTIAVIVFTAVLMLFIVGIDILFDQLFKRIIG